MSDLIIDGTKDNIIISDDYVPFSAYQAIYHKITGRVERLAKFHDAGYCINFEDIKNLDFRLKQLLAQYNVQGSSCQISHATRDGYGRTHSSMERFVKSDLSARECTSSFSYELDFLVVVPSDVAGAKDVSQRFKVRLLFELNFIDKSDIRIPSFMKDMANLGILRSVIEYSDYAVAQSLSATITGWLASLPARKASPLLKIIASMEEISERAADMLVFAAALMSGALYLSQGQREPSDAVSVALFCIALGAISYVFVGIVAEKFHSVLRKFQPSPIMLLTEGDKDQNQKLVDAISRSKFAASVLAISGVLAVVVNLFSSWIYEKLF